MTHNDFSLKEDIIYSIKDFISKYNLDSNPNTIHKTRNSGPPHE